MQGIVYIAIAQIFIVKFYKYNITLLAVLNLIIIMKIINFIYIASTSFPDLGALQSIKTLKKLTTT